MKCLVMEHLSQKIMKNTLVNENIIKDQEKGFRFEKMGHIAKEFETKIKF